MNDIEVEIIHDFWKIKNTRIGMKKARFEALDIEINSDIECKGLFEMVNN